MRQGTPPPPLGDPFAVEVGFSTAREYCIRGEVYQHFLLAFDDNNPLHTDDAHARRRGFERKVAHGAILNGFVSHFIGMHFPAGDCVLHSVQLQYNSASHVDDVLRLSAVVTQKVEAVRVLVMSVTIDNVTRNRLAAKGKIQVGLA